MNFLSHALTQRPIDHLMLLHSILAAKRFTDDYRFEMLPITRHTHMRTGKRLLDVRLDLFGS